MQLNILTVLLFCTSIIYAGEFSNEKLISQEKKQILNKETGLIELWKPIEEMTPEDFKMIPKKYGRDKYIEKKRKFYEGKINEILKEKNISPKSEEFLKANFFTIENKDFVKVKPYFIFAWAKLQYQKEIVRSALLILEILPDKDFPKDIAPDVLLMKAKLQFELEKYNEAKKSINNAKIAKGKITPEMQYVIGNINLNTNNEDVALISFRKIIETSNDTSLLIKAYNQSAICYMKKNNTNSSIKFYKKSIQLKGAKEQSLVEYLKIAQSYFEQKNYKKTKEFIKKYQESKSFKINSPDEIKVLKSFSFYLDSVGSFVESLNLLQLHSQLTDSIIVGRQSINELYQIELLAKEKAISENAINNLVIEDQLKENALRANKIAIWLLIGLLFVSLFAGFYILKVSKQRRIANQKLALRTLRSQMNPHFIFNALNSVNSFISENDQRSANKFLTSFSRLMRLVMENSEYDFISVQKELEILEIYLELEHSRFKDKFSYSIDVDDSLHDYDFEIPPMLIQPYIENAIWHGLRYKENKGNLTLQLIKKENNLHVKICDNGIGRKKSAELKTRNQKKNRSTALRNINERIHIVNELHRSKINVSINDFNQDGSGTEVKLSVPQNRFKK